MDILWKLNELWGWDEKLSERGKPEVLFPGALSTIPCIRFESIISTISFCFANLNKKLYRAFSRQANGLTLNIPVLQGLLRVNRKVEKDA